MLVSAVLSPSTMFVHQGEIWLLVPHPPLDFRGGKNEKNQLIDRRIDPFVTEFVSHTKFF